MLFILFALFLGGWTFTADFESGTLGQPAEGTSGITEANENGSPHNVYNNTRASGGTQSMRTYFVQGSTGSPGVADATGGHINYPSTITEGAEIWGRYYVYIPADFNWNNYDGEASHHVKMFRLVHLPGGYISIYHGYLENCIRLSNELDGQGNHERSTTADVTAGAWNCLEIYVKLSATPGQGIVRIWKDGVLIREETNYKTMNSSSDTSAEALVWTYWNGAHPVNQYAWVDEIVITTDRPSAQDASGNYMIGPIGGEVQQHGSLRPGVSASGVTFR